MAAVRTLFRSFSGGEISPEMYGRIDLGKFQTGLAKCRNFIVLPHGPAQNRTGFEFIAEAKLGGASKVRVIPFAFNTQQTYTLEFGHEYIRFYTDGAMLVDNSDDPVEVMTPYQEDELFQIRYVQSADVLTLVHPNHPPKELRRTTAITWQLDDISFTPTIDAPENVAASAKVGTGSITYEYIVTALKDDGLEESEASASASCVNDLSHAGAINEVTWDAVADASRYNIYKNHNGLYGYIGQAIGTSFEDDFITPDVGKTPPVNKNPFGSAGNYPTAVSYHEQRRVFAGTKNKPQNIWMTRSGTESSMAASIPVREDDAIAFRIAAREVNAIRHIVPLSQLIVLTSNAEWQVSGRSGGISPTDIQARPQAYIGAGQATPIVVNNLMLYAQARGGGLREMSYNWQAQGYLTNNISILAPHLFERRRIIDMAFTRAPIPVAWCISSSGHLLGLTYVPEQEVAGWHWHDTKNGSFESVCAVAEGDDDALYVVVKREINGSTTRYIERLHQRDLSDQAEGFFVDSGLSYHGSPTKNLSGLTHLEGETVSILADGAVMPPQVVQNGSIEIQQAASIIHVGLPIEADLVSLPWSFEGDSAGGQGRVKNINEIYIRVNESSGIFAGPTFERMTEVKQRTNEPMGTPPALKSAEIRLAVAPSWQESGQICIRQSDPIPLTVVSMSLSVVAGG